MRLKEASMTRTNAELSHRAQQLDTRLPILEAELSKAREEVIIPGYQWTPVSLSFSFIFTTPVVTVLPSNPCPYLGFEYSFVSLRQERARS